MTVEEKRVWISLVAPIMKAHLREKINYPDCMIEQIMGEIRPMWELLQTKGLIREGMTYQAFYHHAHDQALKAKFLEDMRVMGIHI